MRDAALLLVDDEQPILNALKRILRKEPYSLQTAASGEQALDVLHRHPVQVVVSDFRMPGMSGVELLREVKQRYPHTVRVVVSGYADGRLIMDSINVGEVYRFLPKPWNDDELKVTLRQCFERHRLVSEHARLIEQVRAQNDELREVNELLEQAVDRRTRSLQLSQEILEKLPMPVMGVNVDGTIVLINEAVRRIMPKDERMPLGKHVRDVFTREIVEQVEESLCGGKVSQPGRCTLHDEHYRIHIRMLDEGGDLRGCTLVLEPHYDDDYSYTLNADSAAC